VHHRVDARNMLNLNGKGGTRKRREHEPDQ
jgi:hypothetical protein